jgi:(2Fe-2S) ferredoxin
MQTITRDYLDKLKKTKKAPVGAYIKVGLSTCGIAAGAQEVFNLLAEEVGKRNLPVTVRRCGCNGACYAEPLVEVCVEGIPAVTYGRVTCEVAIRILEEHVRDKRLVNDHIVDMVVRRQ